MVTGTSSHLPTPRNSIWLGPIPSDSLRRSRPGRVVAIEIKATATPLTSHARHIKYLQSKLGERFALGIILHTGTQQLWLGERIAALPVSALWADGLA